MGFFSKDDAGKRHEDLRNSGWDGPIDQDGRAVPSRTDGNGRSRPLFEGGTGTGTPDDKDSPRAGSAARRARSSGSSW